MKSETRLKEQLPESVQDPIVVPSPETAEAVARAEKTGDNLRKKRLDVKHLHREDKPLRLSVPPYEIRLFKERPEPMYALYGPGPKTGNLPKRSDQYLSQGSLMFMLKEMKHLLLAEGLKECDGTISGLEKCITLCSLDFEDFLIDALPLDSPDKKQEETSETISDTLDKLGKAGDKPE